MKTPVFVIDELPIDIEEKIKGATIQGGTEEGSDELSDLTAELSEIIKLERKPAKTEKEEVYRLQHQKADATEELMVALLPILDSFENLLINAEQFPDQEIVQNWMKCLEAIYKRLKIVLGKHGLQVIESLGTPVDFSLHEVVEYRHTPDGISNLVIEEKQKGYKYKGKVIREARVVVANAEGV